MDSVEATTNGASTSESVKVEVGDTYESLFPVLPSTGATSITANAAWNEVSKLSIKRHNTTQVFHVPVEERRYKDVQVFGNETNQSCENIAQRNGVKIEICCSKDQSLHIVITGNEDKVIEAKRAIISELQTEKERKIKVPRELHKYIIGKSGKGLKDLQERTCTSIQVPKQESKDEFITIQGPKDGIERAIHDIQIICDEQSKTGFERLEIPKIYHPWIRGYNNEVLTRLQSTYGVRINIPPPDLGKDDVTVAGDKEKVELACIEIMKIFNEKKKSNVTDMSIQIPKSQHRLIIGQKGSTVQEIFKDFDVYVHVPRSDQNSDTIVMYGERDKLGAALTQVNLKANSIITTNIIAPSWLHRYMIGEKGSNISKITADYPGTHVKFETDNKITLEGPPDEIEKVKDRLINITSELQKMMVFEEINIEQKFFGHVIGKNYENINKLKQEYGVQVRLPQENSGSTTIRIEGAQDGVTKAKNELLELLKRIENEKSKDIIIEQKFHSNLIGQGGKNIIEVRARFNDVNISIPNAKEKSDIVTVRGNKVDVENCIKYLQQFKKDQEENNYREEMHIFKNFHRMIIGKQGVFIRKIRDETNTRIDIPGDQSESDTISITGKKDNVLKARKLLDEKVKELIKIEEDTVSIPHALHTALIGRGGKIIKQIRKECGGVIINFPPENKANSDIITLKGPREEIEKAKQELLKLAQHKNELSYSEDIVAKPEYHRYLIGRNGNHINTFRDKYNVRIIFPQLESSSTEEKTNVTTNGDENSSVITIIGKEENVKSVKTELEAIIKSLDEQVTDEVNVDVKWHKNFMARRQKLKNKISDENCNVDINFPKIGSNSNVVTIKGPKEAVDAAKKKILELVYELENSVTIEVNIPQMHHVSVIGKRGVNSQQVCEDYRVEIQFPAKLVQEDGAYENEHEVASETKPVSSPSKLDIVYISGLKEDCEKAKEALLALVPISEDMDFPNEFHRNLLVNKAEIVKDISATHNVQIKIPKKEDESNSFLTIIGVKDNIDSAKEALKERLVKFEEEKKDRELSKFSVGFEIKHEHIQILRGRLGAEAMKLQEKFDCKIDFSRKGEPDKVTIRGYEENVRKAEEEIKKRISDLESKVTQEITLDTRVHPRIIGTQGKSLKKITEKFNVDIKFPGRTNSSDAVLIIGDTVEQVDEAYDYLKNLEEEYLQDVSDREAYVHPSNKSENNKPATNGNGFVVKGAPWEVSQGAQLSPERVPDTQNMEDFPTITSAVGSDASISKMSWGPSRK